jgi:hypothetical protein
MGTSASPDDTPYATRQSGYADHVASTAEPDTAGAADWLSVTPQQWQLAGLVPGTPHRAQRHGHP